MTADAKGIYNSPSEKGWATILPSGPNFMGLAMQQEQMKARREQLALAAQQKADAEREKQVAKIVGDLGKPVPTAFPYQEAVTEKKTKLLEEVQKMYFDNADASEIRFKAAAGVQELMAYANSGKQVYEGILSQTKQLDQKKYRIEEINRGLADKIIGTDGKPLDPSKVDPRDLSATDLVYESDTPWKYLNEPVVVKDFLKNDAFKQVAMEVQRNLDSGKLGRFTRVDSGTTISKAAGKIYHIDPVSGKITINDPDTLIENGAFQLMLADRDMAAVVEGHVAELTADRSTPLNEEAKDLLRASVLRDLLVNNTPGPQTVERVNSRYMPTYASSGGGISMGRQAIAEYVAGTDEWVADATSGDINKVKEAFLFASKARGIGEKSTSVLSELVGVDPELDFSGVSTQPPADKRKIVPFSKMDPTKPWPAMEADNTSDIIWVSFTDGEETTWAPVDRAKLDTELSRGALYDVQDMLKYGYKQKGGGRGAAMQAPSASPTAKGFSIKKK